MWLRLAGQGDVAELPETVQAFYRVHGDNMSSGYLREMLADERQLRAAYEAFFERSDDLAGAEQLRRLCPRGLAERGIWRGYRALRERRIDDAFTCLRFAVSAWHGE